MALQLGASAVLAEDQNSVPSTALGSPHRLYQTMGIKQRLLVYSDTQVLSQFNFTCTDVLPACICAPFACLVPIEARRGCQIPRNRSYRWL